MESPTWKEQMCESPNLAILAKASAVCLPWAEKKTEHSPRIQGRWSVPGKLKKKTVALFQTNYSTVFSVHTTFTHCDTFRLLQSEKETSAADKEWRDRFVDNIAKMLFKTQVKRPDAFITCLYKMQQHYPQVTDR